VLRAPSKPLIRIPSNVADLAAPLFGYLAIGESDNDLTRQHAGEPQGERIVVAGRVLDEDGRAVPNTLVELWQCNAAGRYRHAVDDHPAPLDPNFSGAGRTMTDGEVHDDQARGVSMAEPPERLASRAHSFLAVRLVLPVAARHADVLSERPAVPARPDLQLDPGRAGAAAADLAVRSGSDRA
jgi:hypothetical protein